MNFHRLFCFKICFIGKAAKIFHRTCYRAYLAGKHLTG